MTQKIIDALGCDSTALRKEIARQTITSITANIGQRTPQDQESLIINSLIMLYALSNDKSNAKKIIGNELLGRNGYNRLETNFYNYDRSGIHEIFYQTLSNIKRRNNGELNAGNLTGIIRTIQQQLNPI